MIVYLTDKKKFREDVFSNRIEEVILEAFRKRRRKSVGRSEVVSWKNSLGYMERVIADPEIPDDAGVGIEYAIPHSERRIDFILTGLNSERSPQVVIIELKQWTEAEVTSKDAIVRTFLNGARRDAPHPSYQAWSYAAQIEDYNEVVQIRSIGLRPCAYLHNCADYTSIRNVFYLEHLTKAPVFLRDDASQLRDFIRQHVKYGDGGSTLYEIDSGRIQPSKALAESLLKMLKGQKEYCLIDEQKVVYETALDLAHRASDGPRQTLIVEGGPGTGKSVVAINLLVELTCRSKVVKYVTKNAAPRAVYEAMLTGHFTKSRISNLFTNSGSFTETPPDTFDVLVVDEAHRLNAKSGMFAHLGENQIKEIIEASRLSVFFIDGAQRVTLKDIGDIDAICSWAARCGSEVTMLALESQFRCNGSDGYIAWVDDTLGIRETANPTLDGVAYEFAVCDTPSELRGLVREKNQGSNKSRMVAGYCWDWVSKKHPDRMDIVLEQGAFEAQWNLDADGSLWILQQNSVEQVGCIHTCQGLELEYVGVIFGPDLVIRAGRWVEFPNRRSKMDSSIKGLKKLSLENLDLARLRASEIIRNTYRTLMTRGQKGCFVHSVDPETNAFLKEAALKVEAVAVATRIPNAPVDLPFRIVPNGDVRPFVNCLPYYEDLRAAAGSESQAIWIEPPVEVAMMRGLFIARVVGGETIQRVPMLSLCLFRSKPTAGRTGFVFLVENPMPATAERTWRVEEGVISDPRGKPRGTGEMTIELTEAPGPAARIIGELVAVLA
jgi:hypothetical protein